MPTKKSWDVVAEQYAASVSETGDVYHKTYLNPIMLKLLGSVKRKRILDLACGNGYFSRLLAKKHAIVTGIDYSEKLVELAVLQTGKNLNIKFSVGDASNLKCVKSNYFDVVVCNVSFHDIQKIDDAIKECARVLKNKGKLLFSIPHPGFHMGDRKKDNKGYYKAVRQYMSIGSVGHPFYKGVQFYHRPVEYYLQQLFKSKFLVSGFYEIPSLHSKGKKVIEKELLAFKKEFPSFLIVEAVLMK